MKDKLILNGIAKYYRTTSNRDDRKRIVIDNVELADWIKKGIETSEAKHKSNSNNKILTPQDFIRNMKVELRLVGDDK